MQNKWSIKLGVILDKVIWANKKIIACLRCTLESEVASEDATRKTGF